MILSKRTVVPLIFALLAPVLAEAQLVGACAADYIDVSPIEANWRTFAPENRFEASHYLIPSVKDYVSVQDSWRYASDAVALAVFLLQTQSGKGREPYIDNYVRSSLATAFSLLVAYEWGMGTSMDGVIESLTQLAQRWLPPDPHNRIGDTSPFYDHFDPEDNRLAALEVEALCRKALENGEDPGDVFCALESAVSAAVVAITGSPEEAKAFVRGLDVYSIPCRANDTCPLGVLPPFADQKAIVSYPNGTLPEKPERLSYEEAYTNQQLFPLSPKQVERGLAYYFQSLHEGSLDDVSLSFGGRVANLATDPARVKKLTSAASNTGKFVVGYSLYCSQLSGNADDTDVSPIAAFPGGSKMLPVAGLTLFNRLAAAVSAGTKFWSSHNAWIEAKNDRDAMARREEHSRALEVTLADLNELMNELKDRIAEAAREGRLLDSVALVDDYEDVSSSYKLLTERKRLADQDAAAVLVALEDAEGRLSGAKWDYAMNSVGGMDALARLLSASTKLSLRLAVDFSWVTQNGATAVRVLPDALEKLSPGIASMMITTNIVLSMHEAYDMYNVQSAANNVLTLSSSLDPELRAALNVAQNQDWATWGTYLVFDILKEARNIIAAMVSWGVVDFISHSNGWNPDVSRAKNIIAIWSLTLINAVIPSYWKWSEETEGEAEHLHKQALLIAIKEALEGEGSSSEYERVRTRVEDAVAADGKIADRAMVNSMIVSQLLHELLELDSRYASYVMLDRYRDGDPVVQEFFDSIGLNADQLDSLRNTPSERWIQAFGTEEKLREGQLGLEGRSVKFLENKIKK